MVRTVRKRNVQIFNYMVISYILICLTVVLLMPLSVRADDSTLKSFLKDNAPVTDSSGNIVRSGSSSWTTDIASSFSTSASADRIDAISFTYNGTTMTYYYSSADESSIIEKIESLSEADKVGNQLNDITNSLGVYADTDSAGQSLSGGVPIVNFVIGTFVIIVSMGLYIYTGSDFCYMYLNLYRSFMDRSLDEAQSGEKKHSVMVRTDSKDGGKYLRFVSDDAVEAYRMSTLGEGKKDLGVTYLLKRLTTFMFASILVYIFLTGKITIFTQMGLKIASGVLDLIKSF